jgi:hypothetical protein
MAWPDMTTARYSWPWNSASRVPEPAVAGDRVPAAIAARPESSVQWQEGGPRALA